MKKLLLITICIFFVISCSKNDDQIIENPNEPRLGLLKYQVDSVGDPITITYSDENYNFQTVTTTNPSWVYEFETVSGQDVSISTITQSGSPVKIYLLFDGIQIDYGFCFLNDGCSIIVATTIPL